MHGQEALLPIEVELSSLRALVHSQKKGKGALKKHLLDLERLALNKEDAIQYYARHEEARRKRFKSPPCQKKGKRLRSHKTLRPQKLSLSI